jgi:hypothetical protein
MSASASETDIQMLALLNAAGYDIITNFQWEEMNRTYLLEIGADPTVNQFPLPSDYDYFLDQTGWDRTNRWPLLGPVTQAEWQALIAAKVQAVSRTYFILQNKMLSFWPQPVSLRQIALSYVSKNWVEDGHFPGQYLPSITSDVDIPVINEWLLVKALKVKMWSAKGFDTSDLAADFKVLWDSLTAKSKGSRVLSLAPKTGTVFIGVQNVPEGNWVR